MVDRRTILGLRLIALILRIDDHLEIIIKLSTSGTYCSLKASLCVKLKECANARYKFALNRKDHWNIFSIMNLLACTFDSAFKHCFFSFKLTENRLKQIKHHN